MSVVRRSCRAAAPLLVFLTLLSGSGGCRTARKPEVAGPPPEPGRPVEVPPEPLAKGEDPQLLVKKVAEPIVIAAWAEPKALPEGGGQVQLLVRVQKRGGAAFPGVEVRLKTTSGTLFSAGKVLVTDKMGLTRDRLTARKTATITLNAGGTRYTFQVPVGS